MFDKLTINLSGPICNCEKQNLSWGFYPSVDNKTSIYILCKTCETQLLIPHKKCFASFNLKVPYPETKIIKKNNFKLIKNENNLISFNKKQKEEQEKNDDTN